MVAARVLRSDTSQDLALIQTEGSGKLEPLELGSSDDLVETLELTALGFPFGGNLAMDRLEYPSVSVNTGRITSLRKRKGSYFQKLWMAATGSSGFPGSVNEHDPGEDVRQQLAAVEFSPSFLGLLGELEDHCQSRLS